MMNEKMGHYMLDISQYYPDYKQIQLFTDLYSEGELPKIIELYKQNKDYKTSTIKDFYANFVYITLTINILTNDPYNYSITIPYSILQDIGITDRTMIIDETEKIPNITYEQLYMILLTNNCNYN